MLVEPSGKACPHHFVFLRLIMPLIRTDIILVNTVNRHRLRTDLKTEFVVSFSQPGLSNRNTYRYMLCTYFKGVWHEETVTETSSKTTTSGISERIS